MIISIDAGKVFNKIQHLLIRKTTTQRAMNRRELPQPGSKVSIKKLRANIIFNGVKWEQSKKQNKICGATSFM